MQALYQCLMTDAAQMEALLAGGMETMAALISADENQSADVQRWATKNISQLRCEIHSTFCASRIAYWVR